MTSTAIFRAGRRGRLFAYGAASIVLAATLAACSGSGGSAASASSSASAGSSGSASTTSFSTISKGVLTISPYSPSPPALTIEGNTLGGLMGDIITGFAKQNHLTLDVTQTTFASSLLDVQQGRSDMTPFIYYTSERAKTVYYTASQFVLPVAAITKSGFNYTGPDSLKGKQIAATLGEVWGPYLQKVYGGNVKLYQTDTEAAQSLVSGQSDVYINSALQLYNAPLNADQGGYTANLIKTGQIGMPASVISNTAYNVVSCQDKGLAAAFDSYIDGLAKSGQLAALYKKDKFPASFQIKNPGTPSQGC
jgi:ABC-type amino acid transport substrate-binding protein